MGQIIYLSVFMFIVAIVTCAKDHSTHCIPHNDTSKGFVEVDSNNLKVTFAAKVALEEFQEKRAKVGLHFDKVIKAVQKNVDNGLYYHVNFKTHLESSLFPVYICDALVYKNDKDAFYVKKVECKRYVFWP